MQQIKAKNKTLNTGDKLQKNTFAAPLYATDINGQPLPPIVNMCNECIRLYRRRLMPLKTIYLSPVKYTLFTDWYRRQCVEHQAEAKVMLLTLYGVNIEMMEEHHIIRAKHGTEDFDYDFYEKKIKHDD